MRAGSTLELKRQHAAHKSATTTCPVCVLIDELDDALEVLDELADAAGSYVDNEDSLATLGLEAGLRRQLQRANQLLAKRPS